MDNKKIITLSLCGSILLGATACEVVDRGENDEVVLELPTLVDKGYAQGEDEVGQTGEGVVEDEEKGELVGEGLYSLFEGVYLDSMASMRTNPVSNADLVIANEFTKLVEACPIGKELPTDYKVQYREWRANYKLSDLSLLFTDAMQTKYVTSSAYTYGDIYGESKLSSLVAGEEVQVTGIGFDKASGWLRIKTEIGTVAYIRGSDVSDKVVIENLFTSVDEVRYATDADKVICYKNPIEDKAYSHGSLSSFKEDTEVKVIGIGYGEAAGWLKTEIWLGVNPLGRPRTILTYYIRDEYLSGAKASSNQSGNSGGQSDSGGQGQSGNTGSQGQSGNTGGQGDSGLNENNGSEGSGGQQNGNGSGGDQGSNNSGGNSSEGTYMDTGLTLKQIAELPDEEKIALGFTQRSDGSWADQYGIRLPAPEPSESEKEAASESSEGVKWFG